MTENLLPLNKALPLPIVSLQRAASYGMTKNRPPHRALERRFFACYL